MVMMVIGRSQSNETVPGAGVGVGSSLLSLRQWNPSVPASVDG